MEIGKVIFILILLGAFAFLAVYGIKGPWRKETSDFVREGFESSGAPTRASECRCLPGYIPSNTMKNDKGGNIIFRTSDGSIFWNPFGTKDLWWFTGCYQCDVMNICDGNVRTNVSPKEIADNYVVRGTMNEEMCEKWKRMIQTGYTSDTYFCQKLDNPSVTQKCY